MVDLGLSDKGIGQCQLAAEHAKNINFVEVVMSPMRRTIETAFHIFKDHPNFKNIKFKINSVIREKVLIAGDFPVFDSCKMIKEEY